MSKTELCGRSRRRIRHEREQWRRKRSELSKTELCGRSRLRIRNQREKRRRMAPNTSKTELCGRPPGRIRNPCENSAERCRSCRKRISVRVVLSTQACRHEGTRCGSDAAAMRQPCGSLILLLALPRHLFTSTAADAAMRSLCDANARFVRHVHETPRRCELRMRCGVF